jgi:hypothetical protein
MDLREKAYEDWEWIELAVSVEIATFGFSSVETSACAAILY